MGTTNQLVNIEFLQNIFGQTATIGLGIGGLILWAMTWRAWGRTKLELLYAMAWFFFFFALYRVFWIWWHFIGRPAEWSFGWHVVGMLWLVMISMAWMIYAIFKHDRKPVAQN